jgi:hypothetical protein
LAAKAEKATNFVLVASNVLPGTDVMIFEIVSPKIWAFFAQTTAIF